MLAILHQRRRAAPAEWALKSGDFPSRRTRLSAAYRTPAGSILRLQDPKQELHQPTTESSFEAQRRVVEEPVGFGECHN
jgi:hypothetical protein